MSPELFAQKVAARQAELLDLTVQVEPSATSDGRQVAVYSGTDRGASAETVFVTYAADSLTTSKGITTERIPGDSDHIERDDSVMLIRPVIGIGSILINPPDAPRLGRAELQPTSPQTP